MKKKNKTKKKNWI